MRRSLVSDSIVLIILGLIAIAYITLPRDAVSLSQGAAMTGYLWSDTIGWIDLNCANSSCTSNNFGFSIASDGKISGYAWSDNIGGVTANSSQLSGCPTGTCVAQVKTNGTLSGWLKAIAADNNGWDGWISLGGTGYGATVSSGVFSGYAWGDTNVGWVDFSRARTTYGTCTPSYSCSGNVIQYTDASCNVIQWETCNPPAFCSDGSSVCLYPPVIINKHLTVAPSIVSLLATTTVSWDIGEITGCTVTGDNGDGPWSDYNNGQKTSIGSHTSSPIQQQTTYTLSCTGIDSSPVYETEVVDITPFFEEK